MVHVYIQKSSNYKFQGRSYIIHKHRNLVKPMVSCCFRWLYINRGWNFLSHLTSPMLFEDDYLLARHIQVLAQPWGKLPCSPWQIQRLTAVLISVLKCSLALVLFCILFWLQLFCDHRQVHPGSVCYLLTLKIVLDFTDSWSVDLRYVRV